MVDMSRRAARRRRSRPTSGEQTKQGQAFRRVVSPWKSDGALLVQSVPRLGERTRCAGWRAGASSAGPGWSSHSTTNVS